MKSLTGGSNARQNDETQTHGMNSLESTKELSDSLPPPPPQDIGKRKAQHERNTSLDFTATNLEDGDKQTFHDEDDYQRRRREMSLFSAMANSSQEEMDGFESKILSSEPTSLNSNSNSSVDRHETESDMENDLERRKREMNAFAAMANGWSNDDAKEVENPSNPEIMNKELERERQRHDIRSFAAMANSNEEISAFAAMANAPYASDDRGTWRKKDHTNTSSTKKEEEIRAFAAMANGSNDHEISRRDAVNVSIESDNSDALESERQKKDINDFVAMVNQGYESSATSTSSHDKNTSSEPSSSSQSNKENMGTFVSKKTNTSSSINSKGNLDAALSFFSEQTSSSLRDRDGVGDIMPAPTAGPSSQVWTPSRPILPQKPMYDEMYFERCVFPRPLFFGGIVPPRVLEEAKRLQEADKVMSRPLKSAIESFAVQKKSCEGSGIDYNAEKSGLGMDEYVNLFEPVWGCRARLQRENRIKESQQVSSSESESCIYSEVEDTSLDDKVVPSETSSLNVSKSKKDVDAKDEETLCDTINQEDAPRICERSLFSRYARGDLDSDTDSNMMESMSSLTSVPESEPMNTDTFRAVHLSSSQRSGSFDDSEMKRQVGLSDNLYKALQSFNTDSTGNSKNESLSAVEAGHAALEAAEALLDTVRDGRPLTNFELTNGLVPLYGCDDTPLPTGLDLDIFETKEDEVQSIKLHSSQAIIESKAVPNIFGPVTCPSPSTGPNDSRSWFCRIGSKSSPKTFESFQGSTIDSYPAASHNRYGLPLPPPPPIAQGSVQSRGDRTTTNSRHKFNVPSTKTTLPYEEASSIAPSKDKSSQRIGWWNTEDDFGMKPSQQNGEEAVELKGISDIPLQIAPVIKSIPEDIKPLLGDSTEEIFQQNRPMSDLHPSVATTKYLPFLSDRPPNVRYIQIDTQMVGFPSLGEVEPYFCSLAIWNIDSAQSGRVTESLQFDVVSDAEVEVNCRRALWPAMGGMESDKFDASTPLRDHVNDRLQGTRCGVFPLAPDLKIESLFAVLIVHKVLSEDCDLEIYCNPSKQKGDDKDLKSTQTQDLLRARQKAGQCADRLGQFLMPFSFGVAPLVQILGREVPTLPTSRAAQIPLFHLSAGKGEQPIIDHAIAIQGGRRIGAEVTKGGTAMLVLRDFGFLGLHTAIHSHSKLARDRLVDFTGEIQVRRRNSLDINHHDGPCVSNHLASSFHEDFVGEPVENGGRNIIHFQNEKALLPGGCDSKSKLYAKELASIPLSLSWPNSRSGSKAYNGLIDAGIPFHTSFCNELICQPLLIQNSSKRNITVKIEIRKLHFCSDRRVHVATLLKSGPTIHNNRRGPFLVHEAYTSCAYHTVDPHFLDEFKIKLPFNLTDDDDSDTKSKDNDDGKLIILFSVYNLSVKARKKWALIPKQKAIIKHDNDDNNDESSERSSNPSPQDLLGCGYLPLCSKMDGTCLVSDGKHDVKLKYMSRPEHRPPSPSKTCHSGENDIDDHPKALILEPIDPLAIAVQESYGTDLLAEIWDHSTSKSANELLANVDDILQPSSDRPVTEETNSRIETDNSLSGHLSTPSSVSSLSAATESIASRKKKDREIVHHLRKTSRLNEEMILKVQTIAYSSLHSQNGLLESYFSCSPHPPRMLEKAEIQGSWIFSNHSEIIAHGQKEVNEEDTTENFKLIQRTIDLSTPKICPPRDVAPHLIRILQQLWRCLVSGDGNPSTLWANPSALIPLRVYSFSTLLSILNSVTAFFSKCGVFEVNGRDRWGMTAMSRLVALLFDEGSLFFEKNWHKDGFEAEEDDVGSVENDSMTVNSTDEDMNVMLPNSTTSLNSGTEKGRTLEQELRTPFSSSIGTPNINNGLEFIVVSEKSESINKLHSTKDDIGLFPASEKPNPLRLRCNSAPNAKPLRIDTKTDFQSALNAGTSPTNHSPGALISPSLPAANRRKWMTTPSSSLATIQEDNDKIDDRIDQSLSKEKSGMKKAGAILDNLDTELVLHQMSSKPSKVKQMRVPTTLASFDTRISDEGHLDRVESTGSAYSQEPAPHPFQNKLPKTYQEIETAGSAFLDMIGDNLNKGDPSSDTNREDRGVGHSHHRKTRSRCSIDWTLPPTDLLIENHQQLENLQRHESNICDGALSKTSPSRALQSCTDSEGILGSSPLDFKPEGNCTSSDNFSRKTSPKRVGDDDMKLTSFSDRILSLSKQRYSRRWFPYTYEVIIFQWIQLLNEQTKKHSKEKASRPSGSKCLKDAASNAKGVSISCAPILFEVIKKSLGFRIHMLWKYEAQKDDNGNDQSAQPHPLVTLDHSISSALEELISMVSDACIDSRNFDSLALRHASFVVNDSIIRFLRDLFAFLEPTIVHRLILIYFSRFIVKEGKHWQDRDSKIGLRCSWEVAKLRLNAITLFIRFADFTKVNKPLMNTWGSWALSAPTSQTRHYFDHAINQLLQDGEISRFTPSESGPDYYDSVLIPDLKSHWLVDLILNVCFQGIGHAEKSIQLRSSATLYELFWTASHDGKVNGTLTVVTTMFVPFMIKILNHTSFLSNIPPKSQLRKDLLSCAVFVMQSAPTGLMRALWRKLCKNAEGRCVASNYGGICETKNYTKTHSIEESEIAKIENTSPTILDIFSLLNLCLQTIEYEGSEVNLEDIDGTRNDLILAWNKEYLPAVESDVYNSVYKTRNNQTTKPMESGTSHVKYTSSSSRKWHSHDGTIVIINSSRSIVRECYAMFQRSSEGPKIRDDCADKNSSIIGDSTKESGDDKGEVLKNKYSDEGLQFCLEDKIIFARAITSVHLTCLSLRQSDIVIIKTIVAAVEIIKIFGIEIFFSAVGETLQHWMRIILVHCGARRSKVRVEASEAMAFILRLTWDSYGSFSRVRVPLLAIQTEVMERIVATAAARHYREQRKLGLPIQYLTNESAEAALTPLWRTLHRLHHKSASTNAAFKSALKRLAEKMETLYKAYIAAHALAIINRSTSETRFIDHPHQNPEAMFHISRVVKESAEFSKKILGNHAIPLQGSPVFDSEEIEDAFLSAADVFSPTELPTHRVAWLRKLAEFHGSRDKCAEEGTCRFQIHKTLCQAAALHERLWNSIPFWPWANDRSDGAHLNGEGPAGSSYEYFGIDEENEDITANDFRFGDEVEQNQSFRRIFFRVANSVRMRTGDWDVGGNTSLFYGVTFASEYCGATPWISAREMEEDALLEAEAAGELFLKAGIIESSRHSWSLATEFYSKMFNYAKLAHVYKKLSLVVASQVPVVDTTNHLELFSPLGRFYRVYFHGGAANELMGKEFVYRAECSVKIQEFCKRLCEVLTSILPVKTPINLVLDDGRSQEPPKRQQQRFGPVPREPIQIKVTPLRPLLSKKESFVRGTAEWFNRQTDLAGISTKMSGQSPNEKKSKASKWAKNLSLCNTTSSFSKKDSSKANLTGLCENNNITGSNELTGVNKFSFTQPRDRLRGSRDLLKSSNGDFAEKSLRVTEIIVGQNFPSCVTRQAVDQNKRIVYNQSPLEAGVEAVCSWCAVLFRTAVATNGLAVIGNTMGQGIGKAATKVVADCIHRSRVRDIGILMLKANALEGATFRQTSYKERLSPDEVKYYQVKLARSIVIFMEILHVIVGRNRDLLLSTIEYRKRRDASSTGSGHFFGGLPPSPGQASSSNQYDGSTLFHDGASSMKADDATHSTILGAGASISSIMDRTDKCMAIQRELQLSFIAMNRALQPLILCTIHGETPQWMRLCCQDNYFSSGMYRMTKIAIGEDLLFFEHPNEAVEYGSSEHDDDSCLKIPRSISPTRSYSPHGSYAGSSKTSESQNNYSKGRESPAQSYTL